MTEEKKKADWTVVDTNAKAVTRMHEVPTLTDNGEVVATKTYALSAESPTSMPEEHAMMFLKDAAFVVRNPQGEIVKPVAKREGGLGGFNLGEDETLATWDELSKEALYRRCKILAGSEHIKETRTPKEEMIIFLKAKAKPPVGAGRAIEGRIGEMAANELDTLLTA